MIVRKQKTRSGNIVRKTAVGMLILLIVIQFIRPGRNNGPAQSGSDITHAVTVPDTVMHLLTVSCYDCHSNHTVYPWYASVNPVGLWLSDHIKGGKRSLNFSEFSNYDKKRMYKKLDETAEIVGEHDMPLSSYTLIHTNAKLSDAQAKMIVQWAERERDKLAAVR